MKRLKKSFAVMLAGLLVLAGLAIWNVNELNAAAASEAKLELSTAQGYEGDTVKVTVSLTQNPGIAGLNFALAYDRQALTVISVKAEDGPWLGDLATVRPDGENKGVGFVGYAYAAAKDSVSTGDLLTVEFKINEGAALGDIALTLGDAGGNFDASNFDEDTVELAKQDGKIIVAPKPATEINSEKSDENAITGDVDAFAITALLLASLLSGAVIAVTMKEKKSVVRNDALPFDIYLEDTEDKDE